MISPPACHRFVGYLEEEACRTYTHVLRDMDAGALPEWNGVMAPPIAIKYWKLDKDATLRDVILAIRGAWPCVSRCDATALPPTHHSPPLLQLTRRSTGTATTCLHH